MKQIMTRLSCTGQKGEHLIRSLQKDIHRTMPEDTQTTICYTGTKFGIKYDNIIDLVKKPHQHEDYTGETGGRLNERVIDHNRRDKSHIFKSTHKKVIIPVLH